MRKSPANSLGNSKELVVSLASSTPLGSRGEEARSYISEYEGYDYFHLRKHYEDRNGLMQPGKGFSCNAEDARPMITFLRDTANAWEQYIQDFDTL